MDYSKPISIFENYFSTKSGLNCSVEDFCGNIYCGDYQVEVEQIRAEKDKQTRDALKAKLPAATISGTFSERKKTALIQHSGFIAVDIDPQHNPGVDTGPALRDRLAQMDNVFFAALSVSGKGTFLIIPIQNPSKHEGHFDALKRDFATMGYVIDPVCRDVSRLRGISFDPEAKINYRAIPYQRIHEPKKRAIPRNQSRDDLGQLIDEIIRAGVDVTNDYENWFEIGRALANEYGEGGRGYFHRLSQMYSGYKESEADKQYTACLRSPGRATKATLFHLAKEHNIYLKNNPVGPSPGLVSAGRCKVPASAGFFETK